MTTLQLSKVLIACIIIFYTFSLCNGANNIAKETHKVMGRSENGTCGEHISWTYDIDSLTLRMTGSGEIDYCSSSSLPWIDIILSVQTMIIREGITKVGDGVFYGSENLTSVSFPESLTEIGGSAFDGCKSLKSIALTSSLQSIGRYAFHGCNNLTSVTIPSSVSSIGSGAFGECTSL